MDSAVPEVEVDQVLVRQACLGGKSLEVGNRVPVKADGHRLLEQFQVGVLSPGHLREVVVG